MKNIVLVIPALNEEATIESVVLGLKKISERIIVVDDGSTDQTAALAQRAGAEVLKHDQRKGYDTSIADGINHAFQAGALGVVTCDADGQHRTEDVAKVMEHLSSGKADFIAGVRDQYNRIAEHMIGIASIVLFGSKDVFCGLKGYSLNFYKSCGPLPHDMNIGTLPFALARKHKLHMAFIPIHVEKRKDESRFSKSFMGNVMELRAFVKTLIARV